jgi:3-dehydroquinate dehydratase I
MEITYCLPIIKTKKQEVLEIIEQTSAYDYHEVWLDYIVDLDEQFIKKLIEKYEEKLVLLFRRKNLETIHMNLSKRYAILNIINKTKTYVDLDISQKEELAYIKNENRNIETIISYHNYQKTPTEKEMQTIIQSMQEFSPAIVKIAAQCNNEKDALLLMNTLQQLKEKQQPFIITGMGNYGKITRIAGALWGNEMNFAPQTLDEKSAPGQLRRQELEEIIKVLSFRAE